jgi:hypothetical protein
MNSDNQRNLFADLRARGMGISEFVQEFALRKRPRSSDKYP